MSPYVSLYLFLSMTEVGGKILLSCCVGIGCVGIALFCLVGIPNTEYKMTHFLSLNDDHRNDGKQWKSACELRYNINFL